MTTNLIDHLCILLALWRGTFKPKVIFRNNTIMHVKGGRLYFMYVHQIEFESSIPN